MDSVVEHDEQLTRPPWGEFARVLTVTGIWAVGKLVVQGMNTTTVVEDHHFQRALLEREPGAPLITVCNHTRWAQALCSVKLACKPHSSQKLAEHGVCTACL